MLATPRPTKATDITYFYKWRTAIKIKINCNQSEVHITWTLGKEWVTMLTKHKTGKTLVL